VNCVESAFILMGHAVISLPSSDATQGASTRVHGPHGFSSCFIGRQTWGMLVRKVCELGQEAMVYYIQ